MGFPAAVGLHGTEMHRNGLITVQENSLDCNRVSQ